MGHLYIIDLPTKDADSTVRKRSIYHICIVFMASLQQFCPVPGSTAGELVEVDPRKPGAATPPAFAAPEGISSAGGTPMAGWMVSKSKNLPWMMGVGTQDDGNLMEISGSFRPITHSLFMPHVVFSGVIAKQAISSKETWH